MFLLYYFCSYDVYTPTRNIVFHDYDPQANGHGNNEWFKRQSDRFRKASIDRARGILEIPGSGYTTKDLANLGIYGLGRRRTLEQLEAFANVQVASKTGNTGPGVRCAGHQWIPYDASIAPTENLYDNPDNLAPQPEYPLRTEMLYYDQVPEDSPFVIDINNNEALARSQRGLRPDTTTGSMTLLHGPDGFDVVAHSNMPPFGVLVMFWIFGLVVWYLVFMAAPAGASGLGKTRPASSAVRPRKKAVSGAKEV
jgi:Glycosyltransferase (GlcNAc)